jgi:hypothetical protein
LVAPGTGVTAAPRLWLAVLCEAWVGTSDATDDELSTPASASACMEWVGQWVGLITGEWVC